MAKTKKTTKTKVAAAKLPGKKRAVNKAVEAKTAAGRSAMAKAPAGRSATAKVSQQGLKRAAVSRKGMPVPASSAKPGKFAAKNAAPRSTRPSSGIAVDAQQLAHGLNALLHTMHTIQNFEEKLCSMMHAMRHGRASAAMQRELATVLQELPIADYRDDVESLLHVLE